jgi:hypothetical protein
MPDDPFLFEELDDLEDALPEEPPVVYTSPIEQATFDIMELVDGYFRAAVTVEEYDTMQKNVKKILSEAFDDREKTASHRALISRPDD